MTMKSNVIKKTCYVMAIGKRIKGGLTSLANDVKWGFIYWILLLLAFQLCGFRANSPIHHFSECFLEY